MKKTIIMIIMMLLMVNIAFAVPPFDSQSNDVGGYDIIYPKNEYFIVNNTDIKLHFHVHNISNGYLIDPTTIGCVFHLYNSTSGSHIIEENLSIDDNGLEVTYVLNSSYNYLNGNIPILVHCENEKLGGFISREITFKTIEEVNNIEEKNNPVSFIVLAIIIGMISFLLLYFAFKLDKKYVFLQIIMLFFIPPLLYVLASVGLFNADNNIGLTVLKALKWFIISFYTYVFIHFAYEVLLFKGIIKKKE